MKYKILLITQDEPIYIYSTIVNLIKELPENCEISHFVAGNQNPTGKKSSFFEKVLKVFNIFGLKFFIWYSSMYIYKRLTQESLNSYLKKTKIKKIETPRGINHKDILNNIEKNKFDIGISIAGSEIFKSKLISLFRFGIINVHTSDLPKYKGLMPVFRAMQKGESKIGISLFIVDEGIDTGKIIRKEFLNIEGKTMHRVIIESKEIAVNLILKCLKNIEHEFNNAVLQEDFEGSYFSFPNKEDMIEFKKNGKKLF